MLDQFDRLRRRNAFLEQYKRQRMFENGLEEFDDARYLALLTDCNIDSNLVYVQGRHAKSFSRNTKLVRVWITYRMCVFKLHIAGVLMTEPQGGAEGDVGA